MRVREFSRSDDLQLDLFGQRTSNHEIPDSIRLPGREILETFPAENGCRTGKEREAHRSPARGGGGNGHGNGRSPASFHPTGADRGTIRTESVGDCAQSVCFSPTRKLTDESESSLHDPQPLRNQNNYRITDADAIGTGSLRQKCRG